MLASSPGLVNVRIPALAAFLRYQRDLANYMKIHKIQKKTQENWAGDNEDETRGLGEQVFLSQAFFVWA